jgi:pimeloyl-ACP methyl ester carboxylesterase
MSNSHTFAGPFGQILVRESDGQGPPIVFVHGNSSSSRAFSRQLDGALGAKRRLVAFDLQGFGDSSHASDPKAYLLSGQGHTLVALAEALGLEDAVFVGWSLGGHILLEAAPDLRQAKGFAIYGAPPIDFPPKLDKAFLPNPAMGIGFSSVITQEQAEAYVSQFFASGFADIPAFFVEDALKADGLARAQVYASIDPSVSRDEAKVAAELKQPLAILHGAREALINGGYFADLTLPTLWRGAVQIIPAAGHTPHWETPAEFDALIEAFASDCEARTGLPATPRAQV